MSLKDYVMAMAFRFTLKGKNKKWIRRLLTGTITTWDLLKKEILEEYRHPFKSLSRSKQLEDFNKRSRNLCIMLRKGLDVETRRMLNFRGIIPRMIQSRGLEAIKELAGHRLCGIMRKTEEGEGERAIIKFLENLQQQSINIPFVEALEQMPKYAKFMKDLVTNKEKFKETSKDNLLKDQLDSFLLKAVEGYQPSNDEIGSINLWDEEAFDAESELRRSLEMSATPELGYDRDMLEPDFDKNTTLFAASTTLEEKQIPLKDQSYITFHT
ncbi:hypothetical protein Tco_0706234 [Tanacetum coccineum]|uniref:Uncharacterized protein n=1 Tax=Tanacetum coccineum TaxID=301880 RepID=A0ABQ4Y6T2_9ASTR